MTVMPHKDLSVANPAWPFTALTITVVVGQYLIFIEVVN